ncbi:peptidyl-tRNA hydrolase-domain-containing protein [Gorgonomyces haynaldii]|nr:peptidyl-tRNA hydrolase-domain-containing protein [Gorgonomyces haynaldii]
MNAGYIFCDYLSNCVAMQDMLLQQAKESNTVITSPEDIVVPENFERPKFIRRRDLLSDVCECDFHLTEMDLNPKSTNPQAAATIKKTIKIVLVKPLVQIEEAGFALERVLSAYPLENIAKQLVVVLEDLSTLPGAIALQGGDAHGIQGQRALENIVTKINTDKFVRLRLGIGRPDKAEEEINYLASVFPEGSKEVDLMGFALDTAGQALQHYLAFNDVKASKKKYASSKKLPKQLRQLPGLLFPVQLIEPEQ